MGFRLYLINRESNLSPLGVVFVNNNNVMELRVQITIQLLTNKCGTTLLKIYSAFYTKTFEKGTQGSQTRKSIRKELTKKNNNRGTRLHMTLHLLKVQKKKLR